MDGLQIDEYFDKDFFQTNFWHEFCTVFAFQPWHSLIEFRRYVYRSFQALPFYDTMECIRSAPYNQHDSIVLPMLKWLKEQNVNFETQTSVTNLDFETNSNEKKVTKIHILHNKKKSEILVKNKDLVFVTLGSMTTQASFGTMQFAPKLKLKRNCVAWNLWENIAKSHPDFGNPQVFDADSKKSKWESFTITFKNRIFFDLMEKLTGNKEGT